MRRLDLVSYKQSRLHNTLLWVQMPGINLVLDKNVQILRSAGISISATKNYFFLSCYLISCDLVGGDFTVSTHSSNTLKPPINENPKFDSRAVGRAG